MRPESFRNRRDNCRLPCNPTRRYALIARTRSEDSAFLNSKKVLGIEDRRRIQRSDNPRRGYSYL